MICGVNTERGEEKYREQVYPSQKNDSWQRNFGIVYHSLLIDIKE